MRNLKTTKSILPQITLLIKCGSVGRDPLFFLVLWAAENTFSSVMVATMVCVSQCPPLSDPLHADACKQEAKGSPDRLSWE